ncbi:Uncharacterised protein [Anaerotruncus sp. 2789STDY5834896]|uniref:Uncharacterized protein n=1 Tax=uncultured Anaerotruncus sp. TaxID=905011 RepID=A0A1C6IJQ6_9FIRM|nr:Uncharacterised protein [uncultured Anaerotruncus sp.]
MGTSSIMGAVTNDLTLMSRLCFLSFCITSIPIKTAQAAG